MNRFKRLRLFAGLALCGLALGAQAASCSKSEYAYLGSDGTGLRALRFDACAGTLAALGTVAEVLKPRWAVEHPGLPLLYVALDGSGAEGRVQAYAIDPASGALTLRSEQGSGGVGTTFLALDAASNTLLTANFASGSATSLALQADGNVGPLVSQLKASGSGPHRRQASAHAHGVTIDPSGHYALVADMGADRVFVYGFDRATHSLTADAAAAARSFETPPGSGPRRAVFAADGRHVYVLNELSAELMVLRWDAPQGRLSALQTVQTSSAEFKGAKSVSELGLSRDGRFLYVANRGENTLLVYAVDAGTGELRLLQRLPSGGEAPWAFEIHPSGQWLLVANYRSNRLNLFRIDAASGLLADTGQTLESPGPVSVSFVR